MSKKKKKRELLKRELLLRKKRKIDRQVRSLRLQGMSDASSKIQDLEAEKAQILRWVMHLDGTGSRSGLPVREFPGLGKKKGKKMKYSDAPFSGGYSDRGPG